MTRALTWIVTAVIVVLVAVTVRQYLAPEHVMVRQLEDAAEAVENGSILGALEPFSRSYSDPYGQTYETLAGYVKLVGDSYDEVDLDVDVESVEVVGKRATMTIDFLMTGTFEGRRGAILGNRLDRARATLEWRDEPQGWRIVSADEIRAPQAQAELDAMRR